MRPLQRPILPLTRVRPSTALASCARATNGRRQFHLGYPSDLHLMSPGDAVAWTAESISSLHTFGLPWLLAIPLVAVGFNFSLRLPIQYYTRRLIIRRNQLNPLLTAWTSRHAQEVFSNSREQSKFAHVRISRLTEKSRKRIYKAWGVQRWKALASVFSITPFLVVSEALRRLCGAPFGLIGHFIMRPGADAAAVSAALVDETLADGGISWINDLTVADPYYTLPLLCSAILARNSWGKLSTEQVRELLTVDPDRPKSLVQRVQTSIGRIVLLMPLFPILVADLPTAIFIFWATTFALNDVNESILERFVPKADAKFKPLHMWTKAALDKPYLQGKLDNTEAE
ncbi:hypothetical protein G6O67_005782 [Ophiocordyceps sinensis]|uniref:Mitochondrial export translocase Oxa2 n=2 Tax=Ophiocordyceps sinensis TaxID=72228 RepID=A0A8H4LX00_9HYPO|nr:mitochondrial export translocase Oxa2 [Ophiocordyceps sinensis CO18]KAF4507109.1 hypothetical protein G6O67_005782 [Ophiocordyceps sinensis]